MISLQTLLILAYLLPLVLLALVLVHASLRQWQKVLILLLLPLFYIGHYLGTEQLAGWPSQQTPPAEFRLLGQQISEPDKREGTAGFIRLWTQQPGAQRSRLYELPYSKQLHQQLVAAQARQAQGKQQMGRRKGGAAGKPAEDGSAPAQYEFFDRKAPRPPAKSTDTRNN